jgi:hypothetical protein
MTYACSAWELAANAYLLKLQRQRNKAVRITGNFPTSTRIRDLQMAFNSQYVYDYVTKLCRQQAEVAHNHENEHVHGIGHGERET